MIEVIGARAVGPIRRGMTLKTTIGTVELVVFWAPTLSNRQDELVVDIVLVDIVVVDIALLLLFTSSFNISIIVDRCSSVLCKMFQQDMTVHLLFFNLLCGACDWCKMTVCKQRCKRKVH